MAPGGIGSISYRPREKGPEAKVSSPADHKADHQPNHAPLEQFGASAAYQRLLEEFGITAQQVAPAARTGLARLATAPSPMRATSVSNEREW